MVAVIMSKVLHDYHSEIILIYFSNTTHSNAEKILNIQHVHYVKENVIDICVWIKYIWITHVNPANQIAKGSLRLENLIQNCFDNTSRPSRMAANFMTTFANAFFKMKMYRFRLKPYSQGSNLQYCSIVSDNGFAPTRRQAIILTMMIISQTYICVTGPQWVNQIPNGKASPYSSVYSKPPQSGRPISNDTFP